jgi:hypothetical protein
MGVKYYVYAGITNKTKLRIRRNFSKKNLRKTD